MTRNTATPKRLCRLLPIAGAAALGGGCQTAPASPPQPAAFLVQEAPSAEPAWQALLQPGDRDRIAAIGAAWTQALEAARTAGFTRRVRAEGALLDPDVALPRAAPAPGSYRCRSIRMGSSQRRRAYVVSAPSFCHVGVEGQLLSLTRQTGTPRPGGYLHPDGDARQIFIGATAIGREDVPPAYGDNPARNVAGVFERVEPFRYRLVMPRPSEDATLEVLELVPAVPAA